MKCENGHENPNGMRYCGVCASELSHEAPSETVATYETKDAIEGDVQLSLGDLDADGRDSSRSRSRTPMWIAAAVVVAILGVVAYTRGSDKLTPIAEDACSELDSAIVLQVGGIISRAVSEAEDAGHSGPELGDKMRETCPLTMLAIENLGAEQDARDKLPSQMELGRVRCRSEDVTGTVTNNSDRRVDIFIEVTFEMNSGRQVGDSSASVSGLKPGKTANWDAYVFDVYDKCSARVTSVFEAD